MKDVTHLDRQSTDPASKPRGSGFRYSRGAALIFAITLLFTGLPGAAEITALRTAMDETIFIEGRPIRHITGIIIGKADHGEPAVPSLEHLSGLRYESDFEIWIPISEGNGRLWFSVLNRGIDLCSFRDDTLRRGGAYAWCTWQAKYASAPQLLLETKEGSIPQAYGLVVVRDFVAFLRYGGASDPIPNPVAGKVNSTFAFGLSQSARFIRSFLLCGLNTVDSGRVFDGLMPDGGRAGYIDLFRADSDPTSGGNFSTETVYPPYGWSELMKRSGTDAKVFVLNAESEFYNMMAYLSHRDSPPDNVRVYEFPLGYHAGRGPVSWTDCIAPLAEALEQWACEEIRPPDNRMFTLEGRESPGVYHLPSEPSELPVLDELGIPIGGVRLPPAAVPTRKYSITLSPATLDPSELTRRYGTPENYRRLVAEAVRRLVQERFLRQSAGERYIADAEDFSW